MKPQKLYEIFTEALCDERIKAELTEMIAGKFEEDTLEGQTELFPRTKYISITAANALRSIACSFMSE